MFSKLAVATVVAGVLAVGGYGVAGAVTASNPGASPHNASAPAAHHRLTCADAPKVLARLDKIDARITTRLPKLQAAEQKAQQAGHPKLAKLIGHRVTRLEHVQSRITKLEARIDKRCPQTSAPATSTTAA